MPKKKVQYSMPYYTEDAMDVPPPPEDLPIEVETWSRVSTPTELPKPESQYKTVDDVITSIETDTYNKQMNKITKSVEINCTIEDPVKSTFNKVLYLLCIHCDNGAVIHYPDTFDMSKFVTNIQDASVGFVVASCRDCIKERDPHQINSNGLPSNCAVTLTMLGISKSFISNSKMYKFITNNHVFEVKVITAKHGIVYVNCQEIYKNLTNQCQLEFYNALSNMVDLRMRAGFF